MTAVSRVLEELRAECARELPTRIEALSEALRRWEAAISMGVTDASGAEGFLYLSHALAGTAGSFGFETIGETAKEMDRAARLIAESGNPPDRLDNLRNYLLFLHHLTSEQAIAA